VVNRQRYAAHSLQGVIIVASMSRQNWTVVIASPAFEALPEHKLKNNNVGTWAYRTAAAPKASFVFRFLQITIATEPLLTSAL
jgi:hypothetical protein